MRISILAVTIAMLSVSRLLAQEEADATIPAVAATDNELNASNDDIGEGGLIGDYDCQTACDNCCGEPWRLFPTNRRGIEVGGWLNGGIMMNFTNNSISRNDPIAFSNPAGEFLFNQTWMYIGKEADTGGCGWDWGARIDYVFGADGPDTQSFGDGSWDFGWNSGGEYGSAIPQLYGEVAYNDLKVKFGHFYNFMGYEVVQAPGNFFYSHSYGMTYGQPFTFTGALVEYQTAGGAKVWGGYTFGWNSGFSNRFDAHTFLGGISKDVSDDLTLSYSINAGRFGNGIGPAGNLGDIVMQTLVAKVQLSDRWNYVFEADLGINNGGTSIGFAGPPVNAEWYGIINYLFYQINDCWKAGARFEWFDDSDGRRISTVNNGFNDLHFWEVSFGLNWTPRPNIIVRPELRLDWATSHADMDFNDVFINNTKDNIQTFAFDFIWLF